MKRKVNIIALISLTAMSITAASVGVLSWFETRVDVGLNDNITGVANGAYFADGDGSSAHPFIINTPRHLYNLAWLQYLGYFNNNLVGPASGPVYFALDENMLGPLNMGGLTIPPIGTTQFPFWGYFDGNNKTILNLQVDNVVDKSSDVHINKTPSAIKERDAVFSGGENDKVLRESTGGPTHYSNNKPVNVMGMFGQTDTIDPTDVDPHIFDFTLDSATISSSSSSLLVGVAAGYLDSKMSNVAVKGPSINITNNPSVYHGSNLSEYTLVGYATESFVTNTKEKRVTAQKPLVDNTVRSGAGSEFGASIPMKDIYNHLLDVHNDAEPLVYNEVWDGAVDESHPERLTKEPIYETSGNVQYAYYGNEEKDSGGDTIAAYTFARRPGVDAFMYLYGADSGNYSQTVDGDVSVDALNAGSEFCIGDGNGNWIGCTALDPIKTGSTVADNSAGYAIFTATDVDQAVRWVYDNGRIRTKTRTGTSQEWSSTYEHFGFLSLNNTNTLVVRTGRAESVGFSWTKQEYYETEYITVDVGDGTQQQIPQLHTYRVFMTTSQNGVMMPNGLPYSAYLVCNAGNWTVSLQDTGAHYFMYGDKYLSANPSSHTITLVNSIEDASAWYTGTSGGWMTEYRGSFYTLGVTITVAGRHWATQREYYKVKYNLRFSSNPASDLAATYNKADTSDGRFRLRANISQLLTNIGFLGGDTKTDYYFYLTVNGNNVTAVTQTNTENASAGAEFTDFSNVDEKQFGLQFKVSHVVRQASWESDPTYFPLSYESNGIDVSSKNTGYIVSGSHYHESGTYPGDIRVSDYVNNSSNNRLSASLGGGSTYNNLTILTHEKGAGGGYVAIKDQYNSGLASVPNGLRNVATTFKSPTGEGGLDFVRYEDSREELHNQFSADFSHIHGLHFMNAEISISNLITVPHAHLLGEEHENYQMPEDCIDFNLKKNGFITFYAGTYFPSNTTFFSLHQIERNASGAITSIKEIDKIYDNVGENRKNKRYLYDYRGGAGNNVGEGDQKGDQLFDMAWVTNPSWVNNAVYYFEIPVNSGEYALGSVSGKQGAYLMYLDIGSARKNENITTIEEDILTENKLSTYVDGVDFKDTSAIGAGKGGLTANITIPANSNGTFTYSYDDDDSTLTCTGSGLTATHVGEGVTLSGASDTREDGDTVHVEKTTRITYDDFNETVTTTVSETTTINNGAPTTTNSENIDYNVLEYDVEVQMQTAEGDLIVFRYWGDASFTTEVDFEHSIYTITFDTDQPLDIYVVSLTPGEGEHPFTVKFKGNNDAEGITATAGNYSSINSGT